MSNAADDFTMAALNPVAFIAFDISWSVSLKLPLLMNFASLEFNKLYNCVALMFANLSSTNTLVLVTATYCRSCVGDIEGCDT